MKHIYKVLPSMIIFALLSGTHSYAQEQKHGLTWYNDINKVCELSKQTKKPVFAFFTGSDWCGWCHRLEANVFDKASFQEWAKANVILFEVDFPRMKKLPDALAKQNSDLQQIFKIQGYPTVWMFTLDRDNTTGNFSITPMGSFGYPQSEPGKEDIAFLESANKVLHNK